MNEKGFTLIEVILAIAVIGMIAVSFLPLITFSYSNLIGTEQFTEDMFNDQRIIEEQIEALRFSNVPSPSTNYKKAFGVNIPVHILQVNTSSSGQIKVYLPKQSQTPRVPILQNSPLMRVRNNTNDSVISPQPIKFHLINNSYNLFSTEVPITNETKEDFLMNVYRWYISDEVSNNIPASPSTDDYFVVKEWNEAKAQITFSDAITTGFTPNFKEYKIPNSLQKESYNVLKFSTLQTAYSYNSEQMINNFGNRYVRYGVTPYSIAGRIGEEKLSNAVYIEAPRLEIISAKYHPTENKVLIQFNMEIQDSFNPSLIELDSKISQFSLIQRDASNHKILILEFPNVINKSISIGGNKLLRGAVNSKEYGAITIWHNGSPSTEFIISP